MTKGERAGTAGAQRTKGRMLPECGGLAQSCGNYCRSGGQTGNVTRPAETGTLQSGKTIIGWFQANPGPANRQDNCSVHRQANAVYLAVVDIILRSGIRQTRATTGMDSRAIRVALYFILALLAASSRNSLRRASMLEFW